MYGPGMPGTFSSPPQVSDPDMHHGTCVTPVSWCIPGSLTSGFLWSRWREIRSRRMRRLQFYVSGMRPIGCDPASRDVCHISTTGQDGTSAERLVDIGNAGASVLLIGRAPLPRAIYEYRSLGVERHDSKYYSVWFLNSWLKMPKAGDLWDLGEVDLIEDSFPIVGYV